MQGKNIVIFGGTSGIGLALASQAAASGAEVTVIARNRMTTSQLPKAFNFYAADIRSEPEIFRSVKSLAKIDHVVVTSGTVSAAGEPLLSSSFEVFEAPFKERVFSLFHIVRACAPRMNEGSFLFTTGGWVTRPVADRSASAAALAAIEAMAKSFALELAPLRVNVISPGLTKSPLSRQVLGDRADEVFKARSAALPARRVAEPDDIAAMMLSILKNPYITAETVRVDGGARFI